MQEGWLVEMGGQGLGQDGRPGPTAASSHSNAGHASNLGVAANTITVVYKQASFLQTLKKNEFNHCLQGFQSNFLVLVFIS